MPADSMNLMMIVFLVFMIAFMWWQSRKAKKQQQEKQDFRASLQPGTEVITIGGVIGKVVSVDTQYEEIVIDSEGSKLRFGFNAISREYVRPAYVSDDEVDENGNPLPQDDDASQSDEAQIPVEQSLDESQETASESDSSDVQADDKETPAK